MHRLFLQCTALIILLFGAVRDVHAQTEAAMNAQARAEFEKADADLNKTYQAVLAKLPDTESKQKLRETQRAWIASRDAKAARAAKESEGGSMAPTLRYTTMTDLTRQRITELKGMIDKESAGGAQTEASQSPNKQASSVSQAEPNPRATPDSTSPDKKWEYKPPTENEGPKIVKAGTNDAAGDLSDACDIGSCGDDASVLWAPDSKRFALYWGQGRTHQSSFYQLRDDHWVPLDPQPGEEVSQRLENDITAQLKQKGQSEEKLEKKGLYLRFILMVIKLDRWIDSNTALLYAGEGEVIAKRDEPGEMSDGFAADFLFTLRFDDAGNWKIVKTHRLSKKEAKERQKEL
jgi:uncharacterized protein YecT (DUF1311 family)